MEGSEPLMDDPASAPQYDLIESSEPQVGTTEVRAGADSFSMQQDGGIALEYDSEVSIDNPCFISQKI